MRPSEVEVKPPPGSKGIEIPAGGGWLTLVCTKCRRSRRFIADCRVVGELRAQAAGWHIGLDGSCVCHRCPN